MPRPPSSVRAQLARLCLALLAVGDDAAFTRPVHLRVWDDDEEVEVSLHFSPAELKAVAGPPPVDGLSVLAAALLKQLTPEPRTAKALARAAGYSMGSHVYAALRELDGRGLSIKTTKGYQLRP